jgi:hypothetical protein
MRAWHDPDRVQLVTGQGWVSQEELETMLVGVQQWAECLDAFFAIMYCAALGWVE